MIRPEDIKRKAENMYSQILRSWLSGGDDGYPRVIPARKQPADDLAIAIHAVRELREGSKEVVGHGYTVEWKEVNSRKFGKNQFPERILFETRDDLLRLIGKEQEFATFTAAVTRLRAAFPQLEKWIASNNRVLIDAAPELDRLLDAAQYFQNNPRPNLFARELPIRADTKFVERHESLLRQWLDSILPPHAIRADEEHFERRFGLRYAEPHLFVRFLDPDIQRTLGFSCDVLSVPLHTLGQWPRINSAVVIIENKVNLLTVPLIRQTIGLGALGRAVTLLRHIPWLVGMPIAYWGDLDVEGFEILSSLRVLFPQTRSILMDHTTLTSWRHLAVRGMGRKSSLLANLTAVENAAFVHCAKYNLRLEQERLPQEAVLQAFG